MPTDPSPFEDIRSAFERLELKDKVAFTVEAAFSSLGGLVEETGRAFSDLATDLSEDLRRTFGEDAPPNAAPDEPTPDSSAEPVEDSGDGPEPSAATP